MMRSIGLTERTEPAGEIDLRALGAAIRRRRRAIVMPTLVAFLLVALFVNVVTPRYTAETAVLLENQETSFTRPDRINLQADQSLQFDQEAVASQVQLIDSRDIARRAIKQLGLVGNPEFDPLARGVGPLAQVLILLGLAPDPTRESIDSRIVTKFLEKLTVYSPSKTRVIVIQFTSRDADLAMRATNVVAQLYLQEQSSAKRATARSSADALGAQIIDLRAKLLTAEDEREQYRLQSGLLAGSNNMTISGQQLADINSDLSKARATQADAQAKATMIRDLIRDGKAADVTDVINNDSVRRVSDQRVTAQALLAREARTLLPAHPRIKELVAQLAEFDLALKMAAKQAAGTLENEATIAGQRVANLETVLNQQKKIAGTANTDEVHLRALERIAQSYKDQLDSSTTKYQEALARQSSTATPADARVISSAARPHEPSFPKKIPFILFGTIATFVFAFGFVVASELLSGGAALEPQVGTVAATSVPAEATTAKQEPPLKARRAWSFPSGTVTEDSRSDPVFAPVEPQPVMGSAIDKWRRLPTGALLAATLSFVKVFSRSADASRVTKEATTSSLTVPKLSNADERLMSSARETPTKVDISAIAEKIVAAHVPGRGLHIVGTCMGPLGGADILVDLGRTLSRKGRAIVADLNPTPERLAALAAPGDEGRAKIATLRGLAELLAGGSTFAEVIQKDHESRLHYIPTGLQEADFHDFDLILDALSETYDFVVMLTPDYPQSEIAKVMAPYADFVVLAATEASDNKAMADLEREMVQSGARDVLVSGPSIRLARQNVA